MVVVDIFIACSRGRFPLSLLHNLTRFFVFKMSKLLQNTEAESTKEKEVEIKESVNEEPKEVVEEQFIKKEEPKLKVSLDQDTV